MPTYSYRCTVCGNAFDIVQAFTDDSLTECPVCGGKLRKLFAAVGVSFTGSGFYRNDSRTEDAAKRSRSSSTSSSSATSSGRILGVVVVRVFGLVRLLRVVRVRDGGPGLRHRQSQHPLRSRVLRVRSVLAVHLIGRPVREEHP
jgi:putative FmdB family regulatory protein